MAGCVIFVPKTTETKRAESLEAAEAVALELSQNDPYSVLSIFSGGYSDDPNEGSIVELAVCYWFGNRYLVTRDAR